MSVEIIINRMTEKINSYHSVIPEYFFSKYSVYYSIKKGKCSVEVEDTEGNKVNMKKRSGTEQRIHIMWTSHLKKLQEILDIQELNGVQTLEPTPSMTPPKNEKEKSDKIAI